MIYERSQNTEIKCFCQTLCYLVQTVELIVALHNCPPLVKGQFTPVCDEDNSRLQQICLRYHCEGVVWTNLAKDMA